MIHVKKLSSLYLCLLKSFSIYPLHVDKIFNINFRVNIGDEFAVYDSFSHVSSGENHDESFHCRFVFFSELLAFNVSAR